MHNTDRRRPKKERAVLGEIKVLLSDVNLYYPSNAMDIVGYARFSRVASSVQGKISMAIGEILMGPYYDEDYIESAMAYIVEAREILEKVR